MGNNLTKDMKYFVILYLCFSTIAHKVASDSLESLFETVCNQNVPDDPLSKVDWIGVTSGLASMIPNTFLTFGPAGSVIQSMPNSKLSL